MSTDTIDVSSIGTTDLPQRARAAAKAIGWRKVKITAWHPLGDEIRGKPCLYRVTVAHE